MDTENKINREFHRHIMPQAWGTMQCRWRGLRTRWRRLALVYTPCRLCARTHAHTHTFPTVESIHSSGIKSCRMPQKTRNCGRVGRRLHLEGSGRHSLPVYRLPPDIIGRRLGLGLWVGSDIYYYRFYIYILYIIYIYATGHAETRKIRKTNAIQLYSARFSLCILNSYSFEPIFRTIFSQKRTPHCHTEGAFPGGQNW